ncbi:MAG: T9SS type A sorting domain-containing protein, partial [Psychroserpens sp.]|nr:T9SS type A sorting domain-containing protein [Psychroserpens sp.]
TGIKVKRQSNIGHVIYEVNNNNYFVEIDDATYETSKRITLSIRPARYSPDFTINSATYDITNNPGISVPHGVGFVWATVLWDLTWAYIDKYGFDPDLYNGTGGNNKVMQLVIDGLKLQSCSPGFIDGRNALLAADQATTGGVDQCLIWEVFAARGLGFFASQGSKFSRSDQIEDFSTPPVDDPSLANCETLSTEDFSFNSVKVYPNPTTNTLNISSNNSYGKVTLRLVDINGRTVLETTRDFDAKIELDLSQLNDGIYILNINGSDFDYNTKVIKN